MSIKSKVINFLLLAAVMFVFSGCGGRAVPTEDETKNAIESFVTTFANLSPFTVVKVTGIKSFKLLEAYDHNYDFNELSDKIQGKIDLNYLNTTKDMYKGDWAIVKVSYMLRFDIKQGSSGSLPPQDGVKSKWFLMQKPEEGFWGVGMALTE